MKKGVFTLIENAELVPGMHRLTFSGDGSGIVPGQFAEVRIPGYFLRRPFSVAGFDDGSLTLAVREMYFCLQSAGYRVMRSPLAVFLIATYPATRLLEEFVGGYAGYLGIAAGLAVSALVPSWKSACDQPCQPVKAPVVQSSLK